MSNITTTGVDDFWGGMGSEDFAIPLVHIGQPTSQKKGKIGHFNYNNGASYESLGGCTLISPQKTRVLYAGLQGKARCSSDNFHNPSSRIANPVSANCLNCYASQWGEDPLKMKLASEIGLKVANSNAPLCKETYNLLMADGNGKLFFIAFQSTALKEVKEKLFSRLKFDFGGNSPYAVHFDMALEEIKDKNGKYYLPIFNNFEVWDPERIAHNKNLYLGYSGGKATQVLASAHEHMDDEWDKKTNDDEIPF